MLSASIFAHTARDVLSQHRVPYRRGGKTLAGMDSAGFIEYCLKRNGVNVSFSGTNDLFRNAGTSVVPLERAMREGLIVPGVLLLHVVPEGAPAKYRHDGRGNCDFALIAISATEAAYPSELRGELITTKIEPVNGKANKMMYCRYVDYGTPDLASSPAQPTPSAPSGALAPGCVARTTASLRLRKGPSTDFPVITSLPEGTSLTLLEQSGNWFRVQYSANGYRYEGWCCGDYLNA